MPAAAVPASEPAPAAVAPVGIDLLAAGIFPPSTLGPAEQLQEQRARELRRQLEAADFAMHVNAQQEVDLFPGIDRFRRQLQPDRRHLREMDLLG